MFMKQDWLMRQIEILSVAVAQLVFGKGEVEYELPEEARLDGTDLLCRDLMALVARKKIGQAEDLLFEHLMRSDRKGLALAVEFYRRLNRLTDEELEEGGFSREEIPEGLRAALDRYDVYLPGLI